MKRQLYKFILVIKKMISAYFVGNKIVSGSSDAFSLNEKSRFGEKKNGKIEYSNAGSSVSGF